LFFKRGEKLQFDPSFRFLGEHKNRSGDKTSGRSNFSEGEIQIERSDFSGVCQKKYSWPLP